MSVFMKRSLIDFDVLELLTKVSPRQVHSLVFGFKERKKCSDFDQQG